MYHMMLLKWCALPSIMYTHTVSQMACSYIWAVLKYPWGSPGCWYLFIVYSIFLPWLSPLGGWNISTCLKCAEIFHGPKPSLVRVDDVNYAFSHLVAHFTSARTHLPSNLCTYSVAETTTMHDQSFFLFVFYHFIANRKWVTYHFNIISNDNNRQPFCPVISHPPVTPTAKQSVSWASLRLRVHDSENTGVMIH